MENNYRKHVLGNGLRIITEELPHVRSVTIGVWVGAGSRYESPSESGISHFIEHLLFKGTETRSARDIAETIDSVGGQLNAFTGKEYTCFYSRVLDEHAGLALDLLSDMILRSLLSPDDVEKEKGVILEEIRMYQDTPDELVHDLFAQTLWRDHPLGHAVVGTAEAAGGFDRDAVLSYMSRYYTPDNAVVAAVGNLSHNEIVEGVERRFEGWKGSAVREPVEPPVPHADVNVQRRDTEQVHLCIGSRGVRMLGPDFYGLHVLNTILGSGSSSRLFQEIRENRGLAYSVYSYHTSYTDSGSLAIYAGMSPVFAREVIDIVLDEFRKLREEGVAEEELARAKEQLRGNLMLGLESTNNRMTRLGKSELTMNRVLTPDEVVEHMSRVTVDEIARISDEFLREDGMAVTAIGPIDTQTADYRAWRGRPAADST